MAGRVRFLAPSGRVATGDLRDGRVVAPEGTFDQESVRLLPPADPTKVVCVAGNYVETLEDPENPPARPALFAKPPNAVAGPGSLVDLPTDEVLFEGELAVVVSERCRNLTPESAMDAVSGYTAANDLTNDAGDGTFRRKAFDGGCPLGPAVVAPEGVPDDAAITVRVNGETRQESSLSNFVFSVPDILAEITQYVTLEPGDVVLTGTPSGRGYLEDGDHVDVEIEGIGALSHAVRL